MSIARTTIALLGTSESSGVTVTNNGSATPVESDILGDNTSTGVVHLYLVFTSTVTAGSIDVRYNPIRLTTQVYTARNYQWSVAPINGTQKLYLGCVQATRYASVDVLNNATGASATNVAVLGELHKVS